MNDSVHKQARFPRRTGEFKAFLSGNDGRLLYPLRSSLCSMRLEVMGARKNAAREGNARSVLSCGVTCKRLLRRLSSRGYIFALWVKCVLVSFSHGRRHREKVEVGDDINSSTIKFCTYLSHFSRLPSIKLF